MTELFDYCVSNPPYQKTIGGTTILNIYPAFMVLGSKIAENSSMIHPARAFKGAGRVVQEDVDEILNNQHFGIVESFDKGVDVFPNTDIKGGVYITKYDNSKIPDRQLKDFHDVELTSILNKVLNHQSFTSLSSIIHSYNDNKISQSFRDEFAELIKDAPNKVNLKTNILKTIPQLFTSDDLTVEYMEYVNKDYISDDLRDKVNSEMCSVNLSELKLNERGFDSTFSGPNDENESLLSGERLLILGYANGKRQVREVLNKSFVNVDEKWIGKWKVFVPAANGSGIMGEKISQPFIGSPNMISTQTYITVGMFESKDEAVNCARFLKTRFARALLFTLKTTQQNAKKTWFNIPLMDFKNVEDLENRNSNNRDDVDNNSQLNNLPVIDWSVDSLNMIDEQLFEFYSLTNIEKSWLLENIQEQF